MYKSIDNYINSPIPIQNELKSLFDQQGQIIIFDIGACEAEDSIRYSSFFPNSKIFTFEPLPKNIIRCKSNIETYKKNNISLHQLALTSYKGEAKFYISSGSPLEESSNNWDFGNKSSSLLAPNKTLDIHKWLKFENEVIVKTETLNNFCIENTISHIDFIHMDVQGAELDVLKGAGTFIERIKVVWLEVEAVPLYDGQPLKLEIEAFMKKNSFTKIKDTVGNISGDQLYVNRKMVNIFNFGILQSILIDKLKKLYFIIRKTYKK